MLTTNQKGIIAETAVVHAALKLGVGVYAPFGDERCDFIFDLRRRLIRVQCKWAGRSNDVLIVRLYSGRRARDGIRRRLYCEDEIDAFAAYCIDNNTCYFFDFESTGMRREMRLRLSPTRNNQAAGVRWARDYEFGATLGALVGR